MRKRKNSSSDKVAQPYDTTLKTWVKENPAEILPVLLPGAVYQESVDIEAIKPTMRTDRVFKILYRGAPHVLDIEFESGSDTNMPARLYAYNAIFYLEYGLPVISMIVYPFRTAIAQSPLRIKSGEEELVTFHFHTLPLFTLEAERYIQEHITCMYPLLPAMQGANAEVIAQAMAELAELYREDEVSLSQQFVWMELLLERTTTVSSEEKAKIQERIKMYDPLWEEHPKVKKIREESKQEGEILALRNAVVRIVKKCFPNLEELAQQKVAQIESPEVLSYLLEEIAGAPDEAVARYILHPSAA